MRNCRRCSHESDLDRCHRRDEPGRKGPFGFLLTALLGIMGAFGAAYLGQEAGWFSADDGTALVIAAFGAVLVLLIWATLFRSRRPTSSI